MLKIVRQICREIRSANTILISTHERPDGDALGSELALWEVAHILGKTVEIANASPVPRMYAFLPFCEHVRRRPRRCGAADLAVILDAPHPGRLGAVRTAFGRAGTSINIDHHEGNESFAALNWVDTAASCVGQMVLDVAQALVAVTPTIATNLYVSLLTDTGRFTYANTTAESFAVAEKLVALGARPNAAALELYSRHTPETLRITAKALTSVRLYEDGKVAVITLDQGDFARTGVEPAETQDLASIPRDIDGVEIGVFLREEKPGTVKASLRSKQGFDVAALAGVFGGGGHRQAAAFVMQGSIADVRRALLREIRRALRD